MTTIAANHKEIAADSKVTMDGICYYSKKLYLVGDEILGVAGDGGNCNKFLKWYQLGMPAEAPTMEGESNFNILVLGRRGLFVHHDFGPPDQIESKFFAIGAGAMAAMAFMHLGYTPTAAVRHACSINTDSGGKVTTMRVSDLPRKK